MKYLHKNQVRYDNHKTLKKEIKKRRTAERHQAHD
jgi:hypothetical protein